MGKSRWDFQIRNPLVQGNVHTEQGTMSTYIHTLYVNYKYIIFREFWIYHPISCKHGNYCAAQTAPSLAGHSCGKICPEIAIRLTKQQLEEREGLAPGAHQIRGRGKFITTFPPPARYLAPPQREAYGSGHLPHSSGVRQSNFISTDPRIINVSRCSGSHQAQKSTHNQL
jgi:hypothetical protein